MFRLHFLGLMFYFRAIVRVSLQCWGYRRLGGVVHQTVLRSEFVDVAVRPVFAPLSVVAAAATPWPSRL